MKKIFLLFILILGLSSVKAQDHGAAELQKVVNRLGSFKNIGYDETWTQKNPFSDGDTSTTKLKAVLALDNEKISAMSQITYSNTHEVQYIETFKNDTLYQFNLTDSTFSFKAHPDSGNLKPRLYHILDYLAGYLAKDPSKIRQTKDTVINSILCRNFFIAAYDTIENGLHNYTYYKLAVDKKTSLPVLYEEDGLGITEKEGYVIGRLHFYDHDLFSNIQQTSTTDEPAFYVNKAAFTPENKSMLAEGTDAPPLKVTTLNNTVLQQDYLKNKLTLIEFGDTQCGANPLANPMMNKLFEKYGAQHLAMICIYTNEETDKVEKYVKANNLKFPVYIGDKKNRKAFRVLGTPNFYVVDKNGKVVKAIDGYYDDIEKDLSALIDVETKQIGMN